MFQNVVTRACPPVVNIGTATTKSHSFVSSHVSTGRAAGLCCPWSDHTAELPSPHQRLWTRWRNLDREPRRHWSAPPGPGAAFFPGHTRLRRSRTHTRTHTRRSLWWSRQHHRVKTSSFMHHWSWTLKKWSASLSWALLLDFGCSFWPVGTESKDKKVRFYHCWNTLKSQINYLLIYLRILTKEVRLQWIVCWHQSSIDID